MIPSEEVTGKAVHINATNLQEVILPYSGLGDRTSSGVVKAMQYVFDAVAEQGKLTGAELATQFGYNSSPGNSATSSSGLKMRWAL